jgi:hypothetical protein
VATLALPTPAQRAAPPLRIARVCLNGHLMSADLPPELAAGAPTNRADPLGVATPGEPCDVCGSGTILACPGCGYASPGAAGGRPYLVPHFCVVCGEYYPWTFLGEFYATLTEILEESPRLGTAAHEPLSLLDRQRDGRASDAEIRRLTDTFRSLGGSDWDLAAQILAVVLPAERRRGLDLRGAFGG